MQFCYLTNILTQWNISYIWSGKKDWYTQCQLDS